MDTLAGTATTAAPTTSSGTLPPAVPTFILRGHNSPIHVLHFFQQNAYLASGDSDGWIVIWSLASKRAVGVWKAHEGALLGVREWHSQSQRLVTHGRDHRLRIWQLEQADIESLDRRLPVEGEQPEPRKEPWLLHSITVNALNFCAFAMCYDQKALSETSPVSANDVPVPVARGKRVDEIADISFQSGRPQRDILIAVANALDSGAIDFFHLPSERRVSTLPADNDAKTGMVMAISLYRPTADGLLMVVSGYESGHVMVHIQQSSHISDLRCLWKKALVSQPHSQPLLSLDVSPTGGFFLTSSADAIIAKYEVPRDASRLVFAQKPTKILNTKHAGQQGLSIRSDGKVFATAGWDARIRVYSAKAMAELAVLKWHQEGCYAVSFAKTDPDLAPKRTAVEAANREAVPSQHTSALDAIKEQRNARAQNTHWLAAGGKDGKISLWDIY